MSNPRGYIALQKRDLVILHRTRRLRTQRVKFRSRSAVAFPCVFVNMATTERIPFSTEQTYEWMRMFNTLCARYQCRSVSRLADVTHHEPIDSGLYFVSGPDGKWLAEITSVRIVLTEQRVQLARISHDAIMQLIAFVHRSIDGVDTTTTTTDNYIVTFDWCILDTNRYEFDRRRIRISLSLVTQVDDNNIEEERRCLLRVDCNNRIVVIHLLDSIVHVDSTTDSSISIAQNTHVSDCCRPFLFILACEFHVRGIAYKNINLHHALQVSSDPDPVEHACFTHSRATGIHVPYFVRDNDQSEYLYNTVLQSTLGNGSIRLNWRNGTILKAKRQFGLTNACTIIPPGANLQLCRLQQEIRRDEHHLLSLCDFDVFFTRCKESSMLSLLGYNTELISDNPAFEENLPYNESIYERRYCVDSTNTLVSRPFVHLS